MEARSQTLHSQLVLGLPAAAMASGREKWSSSTGLEKVSGDRQLGFLDWVPFCCITLPEKGLQ